MTTQIFKLKEKSSPIAREQASKISNYLESIGFDGSPLDDKIFEIAESISLKLKENFGPSMAQKFSSQEFMAAEEINQHSLVEQIIVIQQWHESALDFHSVLSNAFGTEIPKSLWILESGI